MKKGINTLDALLALLLILFIVSWMQNFTTLNLAEVNEFGGAVQAKASAIAIGSQMNSFYAINPTESDYLDLSENPQKIDIFGEEEFEITITKNPTDDEVTFEIFTGLNYSSNYPVIEVIKYTDDEKVRKA